LAPDAVAGSLTRLSGGRLRFEYDAGYAADPDAAVHPGRNAWPKAAAELGLDADWLVTPVRELAGVVPEAFAAVPERVSS
jgi:hypothetical protein